MTKEVEELVNKTINFFNQYGTKSFINTNNELILIPRLNAYFSLDNVITKEDFLTKVIAWLTYYGANNHWHNRYSPMMCEYVSYICEFDFSYTDIDKLYCGISSSISKCREYVLNNFDERILIKGVEE